MIKLMKESKVYIFLVLIMLSVMVGCGNEEVQEESAVDDGTAIDAAELEHTKVLLKVKDAGSITIELYPEYAPETVKNFLSLVNDEFYDGLTFHRILNDFMIQGGDPNGDGSGGGDAIVGEFKSNGFKDNELKHIKGVISMARTNDPDSATSQFFIMDGEAKHLDGEYAGFGMVIDGFDVLDTLSELEVEANVYGEVSVPVNTVIIESIRVID